MPALSTQPCSTIKVDKEKLCAGFYKFAIVSIVVLLILGTICALIPYGRAASTYFDGSARSPSGKASSGSQFRGHRASVQALQEKSMVDRMESTHAAGAVLDHKSFSAHAVHPGDRMKLADWWHPEIAKNTRQVEPTATHPPADRSAL